MSKPLKISLYIGAILLLLLAPLMGVVYWQTTTPQVGQLQVSGLQGKVTITRDQYGVPHIVADKSDLDAFFALGYVQAQDRFWQMEFQRHVAAGRLSEIFGMRTLKQDEYLRTLGFYRAAQSAWPALSPQTKAIIQSYTEGINAFIKQKHFPLPILLLHYQPEAWSVIDSIAWQKMLAWDLQTIWQYKLKNAVAAMNFGPQSINVYYPPYPKNAPTILNDHAMQQARLNASTVDIGDQGSNNWVISGNWTTTGKPMLANDPHLGLQAPAVWYLAELKGPHLHVIGATIPGLPSVVIGHNDHIAWGVTNANPDTQDLYILSDKSKLKTHHEVIEVRNHSDIIYPVYVSDVGPVISQVTNTNKIAKNVALKWTALQPDDTTVQSLLEINYAQNWAMFVDALKDFVTPSQNFVYADTQGNIGYYLPGKIPIRHWHAILPIPDDNAHQWSGEIPFNDLPHVYNPPSGMIASANNRVFNNGYPYYLTFHSEPPYRIERILFLLNQSRPLTINTMSRIQLDTVSIVWQRLAPILLRTVPLDNNSHIALEQLKQWQGDMSLTSVPATIFAYWYQQLGNTLTPPVLAALSTKPNPLFITQKLKTVTPYFLSRSLKIAMQNLTHNLGNNNEQWQWKNIHLAQFSELGMGTVPGVGLLWNRVIATPGGLNTINVGTYNQHFQQTDGASYRQLIDLNDLDQSRYIQTFGQSNDPFNSHYQDQMPLWRDGKYLSMSAKPCTWGKTKTLVLSPLS